MQEVKRQTVTPPSTWVHYDFVLYHIRRFIPLGTFVRCGSFASANSLARGDAYLVRMKHIVNFIACVWIIVHQTALAAAGVALLLLGCILGTLAVKTASVYASNMTGIPQNTCGLVFGIALLVLAVHNGLAGLESLHKMVPAPAKR